MDRTKSYSTDNEQKWPSNAPDDLVEKLSALVSHLDKAAQYVYFHEKRMAFFFEMPPKHFLGRTVVCDKQMFIWENECGFVLVS